MKVQADIDIDFADRDKALKGLRYITASRLQDNELIKHNVGVYFQDIPIDPYSDLASIPYKEAKERNYFKLDFLNVNIYKGVTSNEALDRYVESEPVWELLESEEIVNELFQLNGHFKVIDKIKPKSVEDLAICIAMIRPAKAYLIDKPMDTIRKEIWTKPANGEYYFKKSHSLSYAMAISVQLQLLVESC